MKQILMIRVIRLDARARWARSLGPRSSRHGSLVLRDLLVGRMSVPVGGLRRMWLVEMVKVVRDGRKRRLNSPRNVVVDFEVYS